MKKLIFLLLSVILPYAFLAAQETVNKTDANGHKQGRWIGKYTSRTIRYEGSFTDDKPVGEWKRFHENGKIKAHLYHSPNTDKASAELFDSNGVRYAKGNYKGTVKDSTWNYYNNLRLVGQENFSNGIKNGRSLTFYENGNPATESNWVNGMLNGVSRSFYPSGKKKMEIMYQQGKRHGLNLVYYESGQTEITGQFNNDQSDGTWKFADENGKVKYELKYKAGVLLNPEVVDSIQANEFKAFDRAKGRLKDPEDFSQRPEEYLRN
ncbi:MAG: toxin-antitoxin system YwqK family antitoxin [Bacteroidia bacterium]|nr:toxin-antitoxin system YwqK family antitoxin [Bacteroidia bacterium]